MKGVNLDLLMAKCYILDRLMSMNSLETLRAQMTPPRVCVLFPGALGDFICFLPALHELTKSYAVDLLARSDLAAIAPRDVRVRSLERFEVSQLFIGDGACDQRVSQFFSLAPLPGATISSGSPPIPARRQNPSHQSRPSARDATNGCEAFRALLLRQER